MRTCYTENKSRPSKGKKAPPPPPKKKNHRNLLAGYN